MAPESITSRHRAVGETPAITAVLLLPVLFLCCAFTLGQPEAPSINQVVRRSGFDVSDALIPVEGIRSGGVEKDGIPALKEPEVIDAEELAEINLDLVQHGRSPFLEATQRVIGVSINGEQRAYGINLLTWHEIVNDEVGGVPVAVVYCPLCDSATLFDRRVGDGTLEFRVSGLLYNSNVLMYDVTSGDREESLWSQLQGRAVSGPHAAMGSTLRMLPAAVVDWGSWLEMHPDTGLAYRSPDSRRDYGINPYAQYFEEGKLVFPAWPMLPESSSLHEMDRIIAVREEGGWMVYPVRELLLELSSGTTLEVGSVRFRILGTGQSGQHVLVEPVNGQQPEIAYSFWFAWYAMHPDSEIFPVLE